MPEGHTLFRLAHDLDDAFAGSVVRASSPQGRFAEGAMQIDGLVLEEAESWGKHLFLDLATDQVVHVHLGLYGKFAVHTGVTEVADPVGQVRLRLVRQDQTAYADLRGATACELLTPAGREMVIGNLGPDPLRADADPDIAWERIRRSRAPIGGLLMDQTVLAGVGNVYRAEILFRHRMHPLRPGRTIRISTWEAMWADLVELLAIGVRTGRIETVRPEDIAAAKERQQVVVRELGGRRRRAYNYVYRHQDEPCVVCGAKIRTEVLQTRNLFWCPRCQPVFRSRAA